MCEIKRIQAAILFPLISEILDHGQNTKISVSGHSMYPFLRDGLDSVELTKAKFEQLGRGDIVMIRRPNSCYVMHRICKKKSDCFFMVGDAQQCIEGPLYPEQLIAKVTAIWRKEKRISCSNRWLKLLSELWLKLRPFRYICLKVYKKCQSVIVCLKRFRF